MLMLVAMLVVAVAVAVAVAAANMANFIISSLNTLQAVAQQSLNPLISSPRSPLSSPMKIHHVHPYSSILFHIHPCSSIFPYSSV
jgi:hypothetical protein